MIEKMLDVKWSGFRMPCEYRTAKPFEYGTNGHHLVFLCTGSVFEWSVIVRYSNVSGIQMVDIQIPNVQYEFVLGWPRQ